MSDAARYMGLSVRQVSSLCTTWTTHTDTHRKTCWAAVQRDNRLVSAAVQWLTTAGSVRALLQTRMLWFVASCLILAGVGCVQSPSKPLAVQRAGVTSV